MLFKAPTMAAFIAVTAAYSLVSCEKQKSATPPEKTDITEAALDIPPAAPAPTTSPLLTSPSTFERAYANTPINWRLWDDEAFALAEKHRRPIFALIGYSVCPWCARMKETVYSDPKIAAFINENFIPVIVDADLHTEVNRVFMAYIQASKGVSGWPLNIFLTPNGAPLSAASYMTKDSKPGVPGFLNVAEHISKQWQQYPEHYATQALRDLKPLIKRFNKHSPEALVRPSAEIVDSTISSLAASFDPLSGGFHSRPKFIFPPRLEFLLARAASPSSEKYQKKRALDMVATTLDNAALSATRDILSGGFFRYSTDSYWNGPNFEKHLIDQALNAATYSLAYEATNTPLYREVAYETFAFLENTFASPSGTFYSSQASGFLASTQPDNTPASPIGSYFTWSIEEIQSALGTNITEPFQQAFGIKSRGNLPSSSSLHNDLNGRNVLIPQSPSVLKEFAIELEKLAEARTARPTPLIDQSIALAPNACAAYAYARAGRIFNDPALITRAEKILSTLRDTHCAGSAIPSIRNTLGKTSGLAATAHDFATLIYAYLEMHSATKDPKWLAEATAAQEEQTTKFYDTNARGFFAGETNNHLFMRMKPIFDASAPSLNSLSTLNLITLANATGDAKYRKQAWETLYGLSPYYNKLPGRSATMIQALGVLLDSGQPGK